MYNDNLWNVDDGQDTQEEDDGTWEIGLRGIIVVIIAYVCMPDNIQCNIFKFE